MDKTIIDKIINLVGEQVALKAVCNISDKGPIDEKLHAAKIDRARWFGLIEKDSLALTEMGKIFACKLFFDYAENAFEGNETDEDDENEKENAENEDWDDELDELEDLDDEFNDDDYGLDDWDEDDWDDEDDDDFKPNKGPRRRK
ncbi:MAG: hypothetical protein N3F03_06440 [Ignavibacteria bacterium]|nr:hypothetical protein [Ignavibacteria bacterium]